MNIFDMFFRLEFVLIFFILGIVMYATIGAYRDETDPAKKHKIGLYLLGEVILGLIIFTIFKMKSRRGRTLEGFVDLFGFIRSNA